MSSHAARVDPRAVARRIALPRIDAAVAATVGFGALLAAVALEGQGGLQLGPLTTVEIALEIVAGVAGIAALAVGGRGGRLHGALATALFVALIALTAASIAWAVDPDDAWIEVNRTLAWFAAFGFGIAIVRAWPERWSSLLGGVLLAAIVVCGYAVLTKVFPAALDPGEIYARLRDPFGYWNSVGLSAAMGVPACLWLGARRSGHAALNALAYPATGLLVLACLLAYSRGSLLALGVGCVFWFAVVPLRLRGAAVLGVGGLAGALVALWAFGVNALSADRVGLHDRVVAGRALGLLVLAMLIALLVCGLAIGFALAESAPSPSSRRIAGIAVLACVALAPIALAGVLATSQRGLTGSVSKAWHDLTNPTARVPANDPTRLTAIGSVRARYWDEALKIWRSRELTGVGAGGYRDARLRYRSDTLTVRHAHGYVVQTLADLGLLGLAVTLALLAAWLAAAARSTGLGGPGRRAPWTPERIGLLSLATIVLVFGVHSFVDWSWIVPGNAVPALVCAGWIAGRGPLVAAGRPVRDSWRATMREAVHSPVRVAAALGLAVLVAAAAWTTWQPQRSVNATDAALAAVEANRLTEARADVSRARSADPLSTTPRYVAATIDQVTGDPAGARRLYQEAVRMQPADPETWLRLAQFELGQGDARGALRALGPALFLDPQSPIVQQTYVDASRAESTRRATAAAAAKRRAAAARKGHRRP